MDNIERERYAREMLKKVDRDTRYWAAFRRDVLWALKEELGTWPKVAAATGQTVPAITKAAYKRPAERTTA